MNDQTNVKSAEQLARDTANKIEEFLSLKNWQWVKIKEETERSITQAAAPLHAQIAEYKSVLSDASAVHANILRKTIPLTREQALHIAGATDYDALKQQIAAQSKRIAELEADKRRLDWLENNKVSMNQLKANQDSVKEFWHLYWRPEDQLHCKHFGGETTALATLRQAIDTAMQPKQQEEKR